MTSSSSSASSSAPGAGISLGTGVQPQLICDPGVTCGDEEAFYDLGYSGPAVDGLQVCSESNYDLGRFGPISTLCAGDGNAYRWIAAGAVCAIGGFMAIQGQLGNTVEGQTYTGLRFTAGCVAAGVMIELVKVASGVRSGGPNLVPHLGESQLRP